MNDFDKVASFRCGFSSAEQIANVENAFEILKCLSLIVFKQTNELFFESKAPKLDKTNKLFALELIKMSQIHMKYTTVVIARSKLAHLSCPKLR